ncbi:MAG: DUF4258 domain-containing protein [Nitrospinae bacterium]|nr:DUF4258 domain-containing protein [Nitrospinota bacterium]
MKPIKYDRHARRRMKEREVTEEEVGITMNEPEYIEPSIKERKNAYKFINYRFLRVTFKEEYDHLLIITVTVRKKPFKGETYENRIQ